METFKLKFKNKWLSFEYKLSEEKSKSISFKLLWVIVKIAGLIEIVKIAYIYFFLSG